MGKGRLEAFTDGVVAIIITIMVLEVKVPQGGGLPGILEQLPVFLAYVLNYITSAYSGIIITTCCMQTSASTGECCGPTSICCSGFR
jgi:uncharacterized membrane protein